VEEHQLEQTFQNQTQAYQNPLIQAENQLFHLNNLIKKHIHKEIPHTYFVVMTNPSSIIKFDPSYRDIAAPKIIRPYSLRQKIGIFSEQNPKPILTDEEFHRISNLLLTLDTPPKHDILGELNIHKKDILPGLYCFECRALSVARRKGRWVCKQCKNTNDKAHIQGLIDYYYLMGDTITNRQLRNFFKLDSISVASKLLVSLNLPYSGQNRHRKYQLPLEKLKAWL
jgi:hypothetical protein